ncbi:MAG: hypothetical protein GY934_01970 [Gammaproteobacteria bacterium]|nr:hypothetical protein [Gammaproteobacteria bacterium]
MLVHIISLAGLILLCVAWVLFQQWLTRQDPERYGGYQPGCGACGKGSCNTPPAKIKVAPPKR